MKGLSEVKEKQLNAVLLMLLMEITNPTRTVKKKCSNKILVVTLSYVSNLSYTH